MIDDKTKEILQSIVDSIEQAADEEDQEILLEAIKSIPEDFWKNSECSITIMENFLSHIGFDFFVYPIEFIPESFWEDKGMVWSYAVTLSQFYCDINIDYNMCELIPMELLKDKEIAKLLLSVNYFETVDSIPQELWIDREIIFSAFDGLDRVIEQREQESSMLEPYDKEECLRALFTYIPKDLALDVEVHIM